MMRNARNIALGAAWAVLCLAGPAAQAQTGGSCVDCHSDQAEEFQASIHAKFDLGCVDCHGGDPEAYDMEEAMAPEAGFKGSFKPSEIPALCSSCHSDYDRMRQYGLPTDQMQQYRTSRHGVKLLEEGDENVAQCVSCHGNHKVLGVKDPESPVYPFNIPATCNACHGDEALMSKYQVPATVYSDYAESVHGKKLLVEKNKGVPTCVSCHGNHGAAPPGIDEVPNVCGQCHGNTRDEFVKSHHNEIGLRCIDCHSQHRIKFPTEAMFSSEGEGGCYSCHDKDRNEIPGAFIGHLNDRLREAREGIEKAEKLIEKASRRGEHVESMEVSIQEAKASLVQLGPAQHSLDKKKVDGVLSVAQEVAGSVEKQIQEHLDTIKARRRFMFYVMGVVALTIMALYLKYRSLLVQYLKDIGAPAP